MSIGGVDTVLTVAAQVPAAEVILKTCRQHWPEAVFQDAAEEAVQPLAEVLSGLTVRSPREFFVYRSAELAQNWESEGATSGNLNSMLHFLIDMPNPKTGLREVTIVCDMLDDEMSQMLAEFTAALRPVTEQGLFRI